MILAETLIRAAEIWLLIGFSVAVLFLTVGIDRIDASARGAYAFRPLLIPGILMIWPLVLWRWAVLEMSGGNEAARFKAVRASHAIAALIMAVMIPLILIVGLTVRQTWPSEFAPVRIKPPEETR